MKIEEIIIGQRFRRDLGDLGPLAESMREIGLLHPVVVTPGGHLIAGARRIAAARLLGWETIPTTEVDLGQIIRGEQAENVFRKQFTPSEAVAIGGALEEMECAAARGRQSEGGRHHGRGIASENFSEAIGGGKALEKVAAAVGVSRPTYAKAKAVVESGDEGLIARMDETGKVDPAYRKLRHQERERAKAEDMGGQEQIAEICHEDALGWLELQDPCDLLVTDPPYMTELDDVGAFAQEWLPLALAGVKPTGRAYVFVGAYPEELAAYLAVDDSPLKLANVLVWTYRNTLGPQPKLDYKLNWQAVLYYRGPEAPALNCADLVEQFSVQDVAAPDGRHGNRYHTWQKPDALAERFVRHATCPGQLVCDPFAGTGTFLLAAARLGRRAIGCEADEAMIQIAEQRGCVRAD